MPTVKLEFECELTWQETLPSHAQGPSAVSFALGPLFRKAGIPRPGMDIDWNSVNVEKRDQSLCLTYRRRTVEIIEYDNVSLLAAAVESAIHRSAIDAGIPGIIPETIKFTIED